MANAANTQHCHPGYEVAYYDRDNRVIRSPANVAEIQWGRRLDDISTATINYVVSDDNCCEQLGGLEPHAHKVKIRRNGQLVWAGWLEKPEYGRDEVVIPCYDALQWSKQRIVRSDFAWTNVDQADMFEQVWNDAMSPDPIDAELVKFASGVLESREVTLGGMPRYSYDVLKEMFDSGLDVTVFGQKIIVGNIPTSKPFQLSLRDIEGDGVRVVKDGTRFASRIIVDANDVIQAVYPPGAPGPSSLYPLVEEIVRRGSLETQEAADNIAIARYEYSSRVPRIVQSGDALPLQPNLNIDVNDLIPGIRLVIDTTGLCYVTKQEFRLGNLDVTVAGGKEKISITTQPVGSRDGLGDEEII